MFGMMALGGAEIVGAVGFAAIVGLGMADGITEGEAELGGMAAGGFFPLGFGGEAVAIGEPVDIIDAKVDVACTIDGGVGFVGVVGGGEMMLFAEGVSPFGHFEPRDHLDGVRGSRRLAFWEIGVAMVDGPVSALIPERFSDEIFTEEKSVDVDRVNGGVLVGVGGVTHLE